MMLSDKDRAVYEYIRQSAADGIPPTVREICSALGIKSTSTVHRSIQRLVEEGLLEKRGESLNRSVTLREDRDSLSVPLLGTVTAGKPITAIEDIEGYISFKTNKRYDGRLFALRVRGDSMINAAILDGDTIVVEQCSSAENGQIVVALIDGSDATVKRFYKENGHYRLQPENDSMQPIILDEVSILGRVVAVIRYIDD